MLAAVFVAAAACVASAASPAHAVADAAPVVPRHALQGTVETRTFWSQALGTRKQYLVWLPPSYNADQVRRYPVAYYLHGAWGDETNWTKHGRLAQTLDSLVAAGMPEMIVVMPDGDDGFYTTWNWLGDYTGCRRNPPSAGREPAESYCVPWPHYDDYIARDLVAHIDSSFRTVARRQGRGIAGLSMGGYGAVALALQYPDVFGAAASHSGVLAPMLGTKRPYDRSPWYAAIDTTALHGGYTASLWKLMRPVFGNDSASWGAREPVLRVRNLRARGAVVPALYVDCGTEDSFLEQNRAFRGELQRLGVPLAYHEFAGGHTWDYWRSQGARSATWLALELSKGR